MLAQALRAEGLALPGRRRAPARALWQQLTRWSGNKSRDDLFTDIGLGRKIATIVATRLARLLAEGGIAPDALTLTMGRYAVDDSAPSQGMVLIDGSEGASVQLAPCCRPIPGDAIVGNLGRGEGPDGAHRRMQRRQAPARARQRALDAASTGPSSRRGRSRPRSSLLVKNGKGVLAQVASAVSHAEADITHIDMGDEPAAETTELKLLLSVRDRLHLAEVMRTLKRSPAVLRVARVKP